jgi:hypothetical protein
VAYSPPSRGPDSKPGPVPVASTPSTSTVGDTVPDDTAIDLGMTDQLQEKFAETLALFELRKNRPQVRKMKKTEDQLSGAKFQQTGGD